MLLVYGGEHGTVLESGGQCTLYCGVIKVCPQPPIHIVIPFFLRSKASDYKIAT
jgi:hypothetical protein